MNISTHVLDLSLGRPAAEVPVRLERVDGARTAALGAGATDADGRLRALLPPGANLEPGAYRLVFDTGAYFTRRGIETFYPEVAVLFQIRDAGQHHHVPLLLSPFGYSTYRGS